MRAYWHLWAPMGTYGNLWGPVGTYGGLRGLTNLWGIQICMQNMTNFLTHPAPQTCLLGTDPPRGNNFFQNPHICVFKLISATGGSF